jgi:hypothetical protein
MAHHRRQKELAEMRQRRHVDLQHGELRLGRDLGEAPVGGVAGVVDQHIDRDARACQLVVDRLRRRRLGKVFCQHGDAHAVLLPELRGQRFEPAFAACHEHKFVSVAGEEPCKLLTNTTRCASDQRRLAVMCRHVACSPSAGRPAGAARFAHVPR